MGTKLCKLCKGLCKGSETLEFLKGKKQGVYGCVRDYGGVGIIGVSGIMEP